MKSAAPFAGRKVLITGGMGFIGSNLARRLVAEGALVTVVDALIPEHGANWFNVEGVREKLTIHIADLREPRAIETLLPDQEVVFNLAGQTSHLDSMTDPMTDLSLNVTAQLRILEACRSVEGGVRVIFASTRQIYGRPQYLPVDEKHPLDPVDVNGIHKLAAELYHTLYARVYGLPTCILRLTNVYGPRMRVKDARQTFLGRWIRAIIEGETVLVYGDGSQLRDLLFVDDCVEAMLLAATSPRAVGRVYNLGAPEVVRLDELAGMLTRLAPNGRSALVPFPPERKVIDIGDYFADYGLIAGDLGWLPRTSLSEGLERTIDFYRRHGSHYW